MVVVGAAVYRRLWPPVSRTLLYCIIDWPTPTRYIGGLIRLMSRVRENNMDMMSGNGHHDVKCLSVGACHYGFIGVLWSGGASSKWFRDRDTILVVYLLKVQFEPLT